MNRFMLLCTELLLSGDEILFPLLSEVKIRYRVYDFCFDDDLKHLQKSLIRILKDRSTRTGRLLSLDKVDVGGLDHNTLNARITEKKGHVVPCE